jgi:uncharacterized protein
LAVYCPNCGESAPDDATFCNFCGANLRTGVSSPNRSQPPTNPNVKTCFYCAKPLAGEDAFYFHCKYCGQDFCSAHRLPESHLCKSNPIRRTLPTTSSAYYTTGGGYTSSTYNKPRKGGGGFISNQGRNLIILILSGLVIGLISYFISYNGVPLLLYLVQYNPLVYSGWYPPLVTSIIVVYPPLPQLGYLGLEDVFFNAISVFFIDGLLRYVYSPRQYYATFLVTGIAGNIISLIAFGNQQIISFGASGGIFGLVAGALTSDYVINGRINRGLVIWFIFIFVYSALGGSVDVYAHLGGAAVGLVAGFFAGRSKKSSMQYRY